MNLDLLMVVLCLLFVVQLFSIICVDNTIIHIAWLARNFRGAVRSVNCMCYMTRWSHRLGCCIRIVLLPLDWCKILPWSQTRWLSVSYCPRRCQIRCTATANCRERTWNRRKWECGKPKISSDLVFRTEPSKKLTSIQMVFRQTACNPKFRLIVTKITLNALGVQIKKVIKCYRNWVYHIDDTQCDWRLSQFINYSIKVWYEQFFNIAVML